MKLGAFSVSISVSDINASQQFYETLGFKVFAEDYIEMRKNLIVFFCCIRSFQLFEFLNKKKW